MNSKLNLVRVGSVWLFDEDFIRDGNKLVQVSKIYPDHVGARTVVLQNFFSKRESVLTDLELSMYANPVPSSEDLALLALAHCGV